MRGAFSANSSWSSNVNGRGFSPSRGGLYAGRGGGRGGRGSRGFPSSRPGPPTTSAPFVQVKKPTSPHIKKDLDDLIETLSLPLATDSARITAVTSICSYTWVEGADGPTILVPSSPPIWTKASPKRVPADKGTRYSDQNSARMGTKLSPLIPIFAAIDYMNEDVDFSSFDLVTDRNNLLKLLHWATKAEAYDDWRIDVELGGRTCLFTRTDETDLDVMEGFRGYGEEYHKAVTRWPQGSEGGTGHHRAISFDLNGLKVLLRFEVDARLDTQEDASELGDEVDELTDAFSALLSSASKASKVSKMQPRVISGVTVKPSGNNTLVPQSALMKLKTRAEHKPLNMEDVGPQMYLSQVPYLYLAKHIKGNFQPAQRILPEEAKIELQLGKLREALLDIIELVREQDQAEGLCLTCVDGQLELYKRKPGTGRSLGWGILSKFVPSQSGSSSWGDDYAE